MVVLNDAPPCGGIHRPGSGSDDEPASSPKSEMWVFTWTEAGEAPPQPPSPPQPRVEPTPTFEK